MFIRQGFLVLIIICFFISGCLHHRECSKIQKELAEANTLLSVEEERCKEQIALNTVDIQKEIAQISQTRNDCLIELAALKTRYKNVEKINNQLSEKIGNLQLNIQKTKSIIQLQGKVISLLDDTKKTIESSLKDQIIAQEIEIKGMDDKLKVIFIDKILFHKGSVDVNEKGQELLLQIAGSFRKNKNLTVVVEGHTDNTPIGNHLKEQFSTNWELSVARATAVVRFLQEKGGLEPERLSACGYSHYQPIATNKTEEGRRLNRRIEIILYRAN